MIQPMTPITLSLLLACGRAPDPQGKPEPTDTHDSAPPEEADDSAPIVEDSADSASLPAPGPCAGLILPDLRLNEIVAANLESSLDAAGDAPDWLELVSRASEDVDLAGWTLENEDGDAWTFAPLTLTPDQVLLVYASGEDSQGDPAAGEEIHTSFKLSAKHGGLSLRAPDGCVVDQASPDRLYGDVSYGRSADDPLAWEYFLEPTPGAENTTESRPGFAEIPTISPASGFYDGEVEVSISTTEEGASLKFTLGGVDPDDSSSDYTGDLRVDGGDGAEVVRARAFVDGLWPSRPATATYFGDTTIPDAAMYVFELTVDPPDLFSEDRGIYAFGPDDYEHSYPYFGANFWERWERPVHVQAWDAAGDLVLDQDAGIAIHGGYTRAFDQKSLRIYARSAYGPETFDGTFFSTEDLDEFHTLVLQIGMDWCSTHLEEVSVSQMFRDDDGVRYPSVDLGAWEPAQVWLNGQYWGYYNLRERTDADWIEAHHDVPADAIDRVELGWTHEPNWELEDGTWDNFYALNDWVAAADLSDPDQYAEFEGMVDVDDLATTILAEAWIGNTDWWWNNLRLWRPTADDGRWRWIIYDFGHGFPSPTYDQIGYSVTWTGDGLPISTALESDDFRTLVANQASDFLNTSLKADEAQARWDEMAARARPAMEAQFERWCSGTVDNYDSAVSTAHTFMGVRESQLRGQVEDALGLDGTARVLLSADPEGAGSFDLTAVHVEAPFSGTFFTGIPVTVTAVPAEGYTFSGWVEADLGSDATAVVELSGDRTLTAKFTAE